MRINFFSLLVFSVLTFLSVQILRAQEASQQNYAVESAKIYLDDAHTLGAGGSEVGLSLDYATAFHGFDAAAGSYRLQDNRFNTAAVGLTHGLMENLDVSAGIFWCDIFDRNDCRESGGGIGDLAMGVKYRLFNTEEEHLALAVVAGAMLPVGNRPDESHLAPGTGIWLLQQALLLSAVAGNFSFTANGGLLVPVHDRHIHQTFVFTALAVGWQITSALQPVLEVHHDSSADTGMSARSTSIAAGLIIALPYDLRLDAAAQFIVAGKNTQQNRNVTLRLMYGF